MPKIIANENKRKMQVSFSLNTEHLQKFDSNLKRLQNDFLSLGFSEKEIKNSLSRSSLVGEFIEIFSTDYGYQIFKSAIMLSLGVDFKQGELFETK